MIEKPTKVDSSMVHAVGYDRDSETLEVVFRRGGIWAYEEVPEKEYRAMMKAGSIRSHMRDCIIGLYPESEIR